MVKSNYRVVQAFLKRDAAAHPGGIGPFSNHPFSTGKHARFAQQCGEANASPFGTGEQAVERSGGDLGRFCLDVSAAVAWAFDEADVRLHGVAQEGFVRECERAADHAVKGKFVPVGVDIRNAVVVPFEVQAVGSESAFQQVEWRSGRACARAAGGGGEDALDFLLRFGGHAISGKSAARGLHPRGGIFPHNVAISGVGDTKARDPQASAQQVPAVQ